MLDRLERALDSSALIALGKLALFNICWRDAQYWARRMNASEQQLQSIRTVLLQVISQLSDETFFVPPTVATSANEVERFLKKKFEEDKTPERIWAEARKEIKRIMPDLSDYSDDAEPRDP